MATPVPLSTPLPPVPESPILVDVIPPPTNKWTSLFSKFKLGLNLPNPGKYEEFSKESMEITSTQEYFDGMKFDFARGLSEQFQVHHSLHMGSSEANGGGSYSFAPSIMSKNKKGMLYGRFEGDGRVMGRLHYMATQKLAFLGSAQVSAEQSMMTLDATYAGSDWTGSVKLEGSSVVELTMMQSVMSRLALGMQLIHVPQPHGALTGISAVARIMGAEFVKPITQQRIPKWVFAVNSGSLTPLHASFTWHTQYKADFATEFALHPRQDGSLESIWCAGALYWFNSGRIRARVDSNLRVGVFVEEAVSQNISAYLCGDLDHSMNKYKFGFGITLQS